MRNDLNLTVLHLTVLQQRDRDGPAPRGEEAGARHRSAALGGRSRSESCHLFDRKSNIFNIAFTVIIDLIACLVSRRTMLLQGLGLITQVFLAQKSY